MYRIYYFIKNDFFIIRINREYVIDILRSMFNSSDCILKAIELDEGEPEDE